MPEMRQNAVTKRWVFIATERAKRPEASILKTKRNDLPAHVDDCFFCWGNEDTTPPEVFALRLDDSEPDTPGWIIRVVNNKYAALNMNGDFEIKNHKGMYNYSFAKGCAEVIIETPDHSKTISEQSVAEISRLLSTYINRYNALSKQKDIEYVQIFRNCGSLAGASLEHPHSQVIAVPSIPATVLEELYGAKEYYDINNSCVFCDIINQEATDKYRFVYENDEFLVFEPYASRIPFETHIIPKFHSARFEVLDDQQIISLAQACKAALYKIDEGLDNPPYNYFIHTAPTQQNVDDYYHWHLEILPKLTIAAGFELATGMFINVTIPEECAKFLHNIEVIF